MVAVAFAVVATDAIAVAIAIVVGTFAFRLVG